MAQATESAIGATASCSDGVCGEASRMTVDPAARTVTHLVIEPKHRREPGRLVPCHLADTMVGERAMGDPAPGTCGLVRNLLEAVRGKSR
jgi:hypothetical protein